MIEKLSRAWLIAACLLGAPTATAAPSKAAAADTAEITFLGYRAFSGGRGVLFVELSRKVTVEMSRSGSVVEYKLVGASVPLKNNNNPLLLRDFASSALTAVLVPGGRGKAKRKGEEPSVRLVVTLRGGATPTHRIVPHGNGAALEIDLPPAP